ncbi:MAG: hemerythrin domain-containing protein [Chloroflexi bacterium]|nr:hemerythrin domain-containing protein [Chloroflexota bacterium]
MQQLQNEHKAVFERLLALENEVGNLMLGQVLEGTNALLTMPVFIENAILPHFKIEEQTIFPILANGTPQEMELVKGLLAEHIVLRDLFYSYLMEVRKGVVTEELLTLSKHVCYQLTTHAKKEDALLIPLLRKWLNLGSGGPSPEHAPPIVFSEEEPNSQSS